MSVLAHPGTISFPLPRRRHLSLVPAPGAETPASAGSDPDVVADVIALPVRRPVVAPARPTPRAAASEPAAATAVAPMRLTARGRAVLAGLAIVAAAIVGSVGGAMVSSASEAGGADVDVDVVTVASGDSLWSIAAAVAGPGEDVRDVMSEIADLNGLEGGVLAAGQELVVPSDR